MNKTDWTSAGVALGCLLALAAASAPGASAQTAIRLGQTVNGSLSAEDPKAGDDSYYDLYTFRGTRGQRLSIRLSSDTFDAYLTFGRMSGGEFEEIESDDDGGGGTNARVNVTVPADGEYVIRANSLTEGETGAYTLAVTAGEAPRPAQTGAIRVGQTVRGTLAESDPKLESDDTYYDLWRFTGRRGQRVEAVMESSDFDAYLAMGTMDGGEMNVQESDDDGAGDSNPRIRMVLPADGEYVIRANSLSEGETGAYTLRLTELPALPPPPAPTAIRAGQTVNGALATSDPQADDESYYDAYVYRGRAGEKLTITMRADAFDTYLVIGRMVNGQFEQIESNDDAEDDGTNSRLEVTLSEAGQYVIRANSLSAESTGAYTLVVQSGS